MEASGQDNMERRLTMATALTTSSGASSPLALDALAVPATPPFEAPKRRRTSACDDLARLHFSDQSRRQLLDDIGVAVDDVLDAMVRDDPASSFWNPRMRKGSVEYFEDRATARRGETRFCCVSNVHVSVEDVVQLFVPSDTDTLLRQCQIMDDTIVNAQVLSTFESPSASRPHRSVYVRYTASQTSKVMRSNRDMLVVVATDVVHMPDGSTAGYCVWDSLNLTELTSFDVPPGFVRTRMSRSGFFVHSSGDFGARAKIAYVVGIEAGGFATRLATRFAMPRFGAVLNRVISHVRPKQLDPATFVLKSKWPDKRVAHCCNCCSKPFAENGGADLGASRFGSSMLGVSRLGASRLGSAHKQDSPCNCHACGEVVCNSCTQIEEVNLSGVKRVRIPVCTTCRSVNTKKPSTQTTREQLGASHQVPVHQHRDAQGALDISDLA